MFESLKCYILCLRKEEKKIYMCETEGSDRIYTGLGVNKTQSQASRTKTLACSEESWKSISTSDLFCLHEVCLRAIIKEQMRLQGTGLYSVGIFTCLPGSMWST